MWVLSKNNTLLFFPISYGNTLTTRIFKYSLAYTFHMYVSYVRAGSMLTPRHDSCQPSVCGKSLSYQKAVLEYGTYVAHTFNNL